MANLHPANIFNTVTYSLPLALMTSAKESIILATLLLQRLKCEEQGLFYTDRMYGPAWFPCSLELIHMLCALNEKEQLTAITRLKRRKFIKCTFLGNPPERHFKVLDDAIVASMGLLINSA